MEKPIKVRKARPSDFRFFRKVFLNSVNGQGPAAYSPAQVRVWAAAGRFPYLRSRKRNERFFVALCGSRLIGFSSVLKDELHELYVDSDFAGLGAGGKLLKAAEKALASRGFRKAWLVSSLNAFPFYRAHGWKKIRAVRRRLGRHSFRSFFMAKGLRKSR